MQLVTNLVFAAAVLVTTEACSCQYLHPQSMYCNVDYVIKAKILGSSMIYEETPNTTTTTATTKTTKQPAEHPGKAYETLPEAISHMELEAMEPDNTELPEQTEKEIPEELEPPPLPPAFPKFLSYKIRISRIFKGEDDIKELEDAKHVLSNPYDSLCGRTYLSNATNYLLMGHIVDGTMRVSLCDIAQEWRTLSVRMKKNIHYNYDRNCECKVEECKVKNCHKDKKNSTCFWELGAEHSECYVQHSYCQLRNQGRCRWSRNSVTMECIRQAKKQQMNKSPILP